MVNQVMPVVEKKETNLLTLSRVMYYYSDSNVLFAYNVICYMPNYCSNVRGNIIGF